MRIQCPDTEHHKLNNFTDSPFYKYPAHWFMQLVCDGQWVICWIFNNAVSTGDVKYRCLG